MNSRAEFSIKI